jgi:hypothetical protein
VSLYPKTHLLACKFTHLEGLSCLANAMCNLPIPNVLLLIVADWLRALDKIEVVHCQYFLTSKVPSGDRHDHIDNQDVEYVGALFKH